MQRIREIIIYHKRQIIFITLLLLCLIGIFFFSIINNKYNAEVDSSNKEETKEIEIIEEDTVRNEKEEISLIRVDVKGAVNNPGVYELELGSRVIDAINMAGGIREDAFTRYLNLSKKLQDEYVILVNTISEIEEIKNNNDKVEKEIPICETVTSVCVENSKLISNSENKEEVSSTPSMAKEISESESLININNATIEELTMLDGIGESKAKAIIEYRIQNGPFEKIEDIQKVSGIGEKAYEKIKESITVE